MVKFIENNGMVLKMKHAETAAKLRTEEGKKFIAGFGEGASAQPRLVHVVAKSVPVSLDVHADTTLDHIASSNSLQPGIISKVTWCRRTAFPNMQKVALLRVAYTSKAAANQAITNRLIIKNKRVQCRREKNKLMQCYNCQQYRHVGQHCQKGEGGLCCARCGGKHRLKECPTNEEKKHCVTCNSSTHSSHNKHCPEYCKQADLLALQDPNGDDKLFRLSALDRQAQWRTPSFWETAIAETLTARTGSSTQGSL
jgi:hypothetical protein